MGLIYSYTSSDYEHKTCSKCLRTGSLLQPVTPCVHCRYYLCVHCSKPLPLGQWTTSWPLSCIAFSALRAPRCCFSCGSPLLSLSDGILRYIMLFLTYKNQDRLLRVCTRFHSVLPLPYEYVKSLEEKYLWKDPYDILHASRRSIVLRGVDRLTGTTHALKLIPKSQMFSRRMWQRLQQGIDIRIAASAFPAFFMSFHSAFQTRDFIVLVMELLPPERYQPLSTLMRSGMIGEAESRLIIARVLEAVRCLHDELHVVHRELSPDALFVADDNIEDIRVLHFHHTRFLKSSLHSSYLQSLWKKQQKQKQQQQQQQLQKPSLSALPRDSGDFEVKEDSTTTAPTPSHAARQISRPPPLSIPVDIGLLRMAGIYAKLAREREAQLQEAARRSRNFSQSTLETLCHSGCGVSPSGVTMEGSVGFSIPAVGSHQHVQLGSMAADSLGPPGINDVDDSIIVATPRAAVAYVAPELGEALCACSVVPSLSIRAGDVKKWDVFAIGGIFCQLLACSVRQSTDSHCCIDWETLSASITGDSIVLLLSLMHIEPAQRVSCGEAIKLMCDQVGTYAPVNLE
ncbi:hypothetical protein DQ04_04251060 [Trypanosoma grayi]|uniref:hypothetical protein n=1 Tax=Trypanosoma grayi TaxID=71804 RepID=UPI0004F42FD9|nr:hypothetical protein DQ04_04251060 [Trypanosoma grayi]KEG10051.1 hypothetical protein DQ04_04251060 [Trypanosoma grayi]